MVSLITLLRETQPTDEVAEAILQGLAAGLFAAWPIWLLLGLLAFTYLAVGIIRRVVRDGRLSRSGIEEIDRFGGETFEQRLTVLFRSKGYVVERTKFVGDYGGDLVLRRNGTRTAVQAKRWTKAVGVRAIQEVLGARAYYDCGEAMVVTNSRYTKQAVNLARKSGVVLWDRERLVKELQSARTDAPAPAEGTDPEPITVQPDAEETLVAEGSATALPSVEACAICSRVLSAGERRYCERNTNRFGGRMLCFRHQRANRQPH